MSAELVPHRIEAVYPMFGDLSPEAWTTIVFGYHLLAGDILSYEFLASTTTPEGVHHVVVGFTMLCDLNNIGSSVDAFLDSATNEAHEWDVRYVLPVSPPTPQSFEFEVSCFFITKTEEQARLIQQFFNDAQALMTCETSQFNTTGILPSVRS